MHPPSGAQLQCTAMGFFLSVKDRCFSIKWCGGLFYVDFECTRFSILSGIYVLVCVLDSVWYCVVLMCGLFIDSVCVLMVLVCFGTNSIE
jgi:hypothetical protein